MCRAFHAFFGCFGNIAHFFDLSTPLGGQFCARVENSQNVPESTTVLTNIFIVQLTAAVDGNPDKLQMTIEALRANPNITDEALAQHLTLKRPASARFWRLKAIEILNAPGREPSGATSGKTASLRNTDAWSTPAGAVNGNRQQTLT
jgi:hypothetical protein